MGLSKKPYKGCRDFFPEVMRKRSYMFSKMHSTSALFAYEQYDGPLLEEVALYLAKSGEELISDQIYDFTDRGKRHVAIRPEMTPTVARMAAQVHRETSKPFRWYSISNFMRYERPQRGRLREFSQLNVDIFGAPDELGSYEILDYIVKLFESYGANRTMFEIKLNDRRVVDLIFNEVFKLDTKTALKVYKLIDRSAKIAQEKLEDEAKLLLGDKAESFFKYLNLKDFNDLEKFLKDFSLDNKDASIQFLKTKELISSSPICEYINFDPTIVRGLDYYTGLVFEVFDLHPDNRRALAGGGAYANLLQIFNEQPLHGIGFGMGDVTLQDFLESHNLMPQLDHQEHDLFITYFDKDCEKACIELSHKLRQKNQKVELNLGTIKPNKTLKLALNKGHRFLAQMGSQEKQSNQVQIKNLITKESQNFDLDDIQKIIDFIQA